MVRQDASGSHRVVDFSMEYQRMDYALSMGNVYWWMIVLECGLTQFVRKSGLILGLEEVVRWSLG